MRFVALLIPLILGVTVLHLIVIIQGRMVYLICTPEVRGPQALRLQVYISDRPLIPVLQLSIV